MLNQIILGGVALTAIIGLSAIGGSFYTVPEGHVGIVKTFSKATSQTDPGLNFKTPFIQGVEEIEVRERRNIEDFSAASKEELPIVVTAAINWSVNKEDAFDLFVKYGSLEQFENRVIDPMFAQVTKAVVSQYSASTLRTNRTDAVSDLRAALEERSKNLPITISSPNIVNVSLPEAYTEAILRKEKARQDALAEQEKLKQQKLQAQQKVQTAEAEANAKRAQAKGEADARVTRATAEAQAILTLKEAEAEGVRQVALAIKSNPELIEYEKIKNWNGELPTHTLSSETPIMLNIGK